MTAAFMTSSMPYFFNPDTKIDLVKEFHLQDQVSEFDFATVEDANILYDYVRLEGSSTITIEPVTDVSSQSSTTSNTDVSVLDIGMSANEIITLMDTRNIGEGYPLISTSSKVESTVDLPSGESYLCTRYDISSGISAYFLTDKKTSALRQFVFETDRTKLKSSGGKLSGYMIASLPFLLEPDKAEVIIDSLQLMDIGYNINTAWEGQSRKYLFSRTEKVETLCVIPLKCDTIPIANLDFKDSEKEWSIDSYVEAMNVFIKENKAALRLTNPIDSDEQPGYVGEKFLLGKGTNVTLYESKETGLIDCISLVLNIDRADEVGLNTFSTIAAYSPLLLEPDNGKKVKEELRLSEIPMDDSRISVGSTMRYKYQGTDSQILLVMTRQDSKIEAEFMK